MSPVVLRSHPAIRANAGQVALRRGPIVYCLEAQDAAPLDLAKAAVVLDPRDPSSSVRDVYDESLRLHVLRAQVGERRSRPDEPSPGEAPYVALEPFGPVRVREVSWVPFYFRANRSEDSRWITWIPVAGNTP
jgi:DUF1680 family protein